MKKVRWLIASLILGFLIGLTIKNVYSLTARQPYSWNSPPIVINCADNDIKEETIARAINYWKEKGEEIYFYEYKPIDSICAQPDLVDGFIIIKTAVPKEIKDDAILASTKRSSNLTSIQSAIISFKPGTHNFDLLLEHELGHAFGYTHRKIPGHIMHPYYDMMGTKFW
jgi:hypothetical protein